MKFLDFTFNCWVWGRAFFFLHVSFDCISLSLLPMVFYSSFRREVSAMENSDDMYMFLHFLLAKGNEKRGLFTWNGK